MTYQEWKSLKMVRGEDTKKIVRDFERSNPGLTALFEKEKEKEEQQMRAALTIDDRVERWKRIAEINQDPTFAERRRREEMQKAR